MADSKALPSKKNGSEQKSKESFELLMDRLEKVVTALEEGEISLEESLKLFEEGVQLSREAAHHLEMVDRQIEAALKSKKGASSTSEPE